MITHANALSFLDWCSSEFRPDETDRFANYSPLYFDASVFDVYLSIKHGASVHLVERRACEAARRHGGIHRPAAADLLVVDAIRADDARAFRQSRGA